jgi:hypothetical protein
MSNNAGAPTPRNPVRPRTLTCGPVTVSVDKDGFSKTLGGYVEVRNGQLLRFDQPKEGTA